MSEYVRLARGLENQVSEMVPVNEDIYKIVRTRPTQDFYQSLFKYNEEHFQQFKKTRSVAGTTDLRTNKILFDFDSASNIDLARKDALVTIDRLNKAGIPTEKIKLFFSGNKGFGVEVVTNQALTRQEFVNLVFGLAGDLVTFDTRINDCNRIIRVPLTRHQTSKLYKIPLVFEELKNWSIDEIKAEAKDITGYQTEDLKDDNYTVELTPGLIELKNTLYKKVESTLKIEPPSADFEDVDFTKAPSWMSPERFALQEGCFYGSNSVETGERNTAFLILAATYKHQGFSADHALGLLMATAEKQAVRTGEDPYTDSQMQREIISTVYNTSWRGGLFPKDEPLLIKTRQRFNLEDDDLDTETSVINIANVGEGFKDFAKNMKQNRILTGLKSLDENLVLTAGMLCTVVSAPGGGKTALANFISETTSTGGENVLYFSLDLYKNILFGRLLQRHTRLDFKSILEQFESGDVADDVISAYSQVVESYSNVGFSFKSSSIDDIEQEIKQNIQMKGKAPKVVIVDYLDKVKSPYSDPTQSSAHVAGRLSDIAKKYDCLVLLMAQPSKFGSSGPEQEFKSYRSLKGSSSIESDSRVVLGIHRPGYLPSDQSRDLYSCITILKNNIGPLMRLDYGWDGVSGMFTELSSEQRRSLKSLRQELEASKAASDDI